MHFYNCIWVVLLISRLNLAFLSPKLSCSIDKVLVYLCPYGFDNPRNTLRWKLLQLASVRMWIILFGLRTANSEQLKLPQRRCRNHEVGDSKLWQTNHRVIFLGLPFLLLFNSYSCFCFIYCSVLACEVDIMYIYHWLSREVHCKHFCELDYILWWFNFCSCFSL
jgi:hypothetical protein